MANVRRTLADILVSFEHATFRLRSPSVTSRSVWSVKPVFILPDTSWRIERGEHHLILGPNGGGKSSLCLAIAGKLPASQGTVTHSIPPSSIALVSFREQQQLLQHEKRKESESAFMSRHYQSEPAGDVLARVWNGDKPTLARFSDLVQFTHAWPRPVASLSTGEVRKFLLLRALSTKLQLLILDEPFDGLDAASRAALKVLIDTVAAERLCSVILTTHRANELSPIFTHTALVAGGRMHAFGPTAKVLTNENFTAAFGHTRDSTLGSSGDVGRRQLPDVIQAAFSQQSSQVQDIATLDKVNVRYENGVHALKDLSWSFVRGQHWQVCGANGSGKSTLVQILLGNHPQVYSNSVSVLGKRYGLEGQSAADVKNRIGILSTETHSSYTSHSRVLDVICSGFYDSIGLYTMCDPSQKAMAKAWAEYLGLLSLTTRAFSELSQGQQRLVLLARAMVKAPSLLILDEPYHGLDHRHRVRLRELIETVAQCTSTAMLLITHHEGDVSPCITHQLTLDRGIATYTGQVHSRRAVK